MALLSLIVRQASACSVVALLGVSAAAAQETEVTPEAAAKPHAPGLFGGTGSRNGGGASGLSVTVAQAYDSNIFGDSVSPTSSALQQGGFYTELVANVNVRAGNKKLQFATSAGTDFRYYNDQQEVVGVGHFANAGMTYVASQRATISVDGGVSYAPSYLYQLFNSVVPAVGTAPGLGSTGYAANDTSFWRYDARGALTEKLSERNHLIFRTAASYTDFSRTDLSFGGLPQRDLSTFEGDVLFGRHVNRDFNLNVGYVYRRAQYYTGVFPTENSLTVGGDYTRLLSRTRRTHLQFNLSVSSLEAVVPGDDIATLRQQMRLSGDVSLNRQFGRTWQAGGGYRRGYEFIEGLTRPVWTDGVNFNTTGLLTPRVDLAASAAYSVGEPINLEQTRGFTTYTANVRTRVALSKTWAVSLEYLYYYYDFSRVLVPIGTPPTMSRNTGRVGLTWWFPMMRS
jgi:hypothetical protein